MLSWANSTDPEYDVEGAIEFCAVTVHARTAGTVTNGTNTSMTMGVQANLTSYGFRILQARRSAFPLVPQSSSARDAGTS